MTAVPPVWNREIDTQVDAAKRELLAEFPGSQVSIREVQDDRGVVAILVTVGDGRLVAAARTVDLAPIVWPWPGGIASTVGILPNRQFPTVDEVIRGLVAA